MRSPSRGGGEEGWGVRILSRPQVVSDLGTQIQFISVYVQFNAHPEFAALPSIFPTHFLYDWLTEWLLSKQGAAHW